MKSLRNAELLLAALLVFFVVAVSGFHYIEGWSWFDSLYMVVMTLTTVGYREVHPLSLPGQRFNIFVMLSGVSILLVGVGVLTQALLEFELSEFFGRRRMERDIARLSGHYIICGAGRVGRSAGRALATEKVPFVFVETTEEKLVRLPEDWPRIVGDASLEEILRKARIEEAKGLVAATTTDGTNLFIVMAARALNPNLRIIARASEEASEKHLRAAGAQVVISPYTFAGYRIAQSFLRPHVLSFLDMATVSDGQTELEFEQVHIEKGSRYAGQHLGDSGIRQDTGVIVLAINRSGQTMHFNPAPEEEIHAGDTLIVMGEPRGLQRLEELASKAQ